MQPIFNRPMTHLDHIGGSNCEEWRCEVCGREWVCPTVPKCICFDRAPVMTKSDMVARYSRGEFGNCSPTWNTYNDWAQDHLGGDKFQLFHIRNRNAAAETWYDVPKYKMADMWAVARKMFPENQLYISAMCPTHKTLIQGEVMQAFPGSGACGLQLYYSTVKKPMRKALAERAEQTHGLKAVMLLRHYMDANSYDWLQYLLDAYPAHVIEFTTLSTKWGTLPNFNTLFWEVRGGY